jgi:hypothetical protein
MSRINPSRSAKTIALNRIKSIITDDLIDTGYPLKIICIVRENKHICQALMNKASAYPNKEQCKANAYYNAAQYIANMNTSIYNELYSFPQWIAPSDSGIDFNIQTFIDKYARANPVHAINYTQHEHKCEIRPQKAKLPHDDISFTNFLERVNASYISLCKEANRIENSRRIQRGQPQYSIDKPRRSARLANKQHVTYFSNKAT